MTRPVPDRRRRPCGSSARASRTSPASALDAAAGSSAVLGRGDDVPARPPASTCSCSPCPTRPSPRWRAAGRRPLRRRSSPTSPARSGSTVLAPHAAPGRRCTRSCRCPTPTIGAARLGGGAWFGSPPTATRSPPTSSPTSAAAPSPSPRRDRARYHAAAAIAANHLVALLGQVERVAGPIGVPLDAYLDLARGAVDNVAALGPAAALTGPVARGDEATMARHRAALPPEEVAAYDAGVALCRQLLETSVAVTEVHETIASFRAALAPAAAVGRVRADDGLPARGHRSLLDAARRRQRRRRPRRSS